MICKLCGKVLAADKKSLYVQGVKFELHKVCLRKATRKELVEKGLIKPGDASWML